jgi:hypothetical protein
VGCRARRVTLSQESTPLACDPAGRCALPHANTTATLTGDIAGTAVGVPGLGSGDLASLTGSGTFTITHTNPDLSNLSAWQGKVRCGTNSQG